MNRLKGLSKINKTKNIEKKSPEVSVRASATKDGNPVEMEEQRIQLDPVETDGTFITLSADTGNSISYGKESIKVHAGITMPTVAQEDYIEESFNQAREIIFNQLKLTKAYGIEALDLKLIEE